MSIVFVKKPYWMPYGSDTIVFQSVKGLFFVQKKMIDTKEKFEWGFISSFDNKKVSCWGGISDKIEDAKEICETSHRISIQNIYYKYLDGPEIEE